MFRLINSILMVCFVFLVGYFFGVKEVRFYEVISGSMEPTLKVNDRIMTIKKTGFPRKSIVMIRDPLASDEILAKRIIGLPGETIEIKNGKVYIDGRKLREPYIKEAPDYRLKKEIPEHHYFLLGDNRNRSEDSSVWGPVDEELIMSKAILKYWPFKEFKIVARPSIDI
ncbi:MAG: signal peptidase I [Petrimonas sp.]|jgi:signal peptidase I|nr:signal peptidase I [Petrimonas sp.]